MAFISYLFSIVLVTLAFFPFSNAFNIVSLSKPARIRTTKDINMRWGLKGPQANIPMGKTEDGKLLRDTVPFELRGFSLPIVVFTVGLLLTASSFVGYFLNSVNGEGGSVSSIGFVYGIPVFLIGLSLWYAELAPVEVISSPSGDNAYEKLATDTMIKIKQDVTRHRYGDDAHLDSTLDALGLKLPQKKYPKMRSIIQEETPEGELAFTMTFQSIDTPFKVWADSEKIKKYDTFFGPGIVSSVIKVDSDKRIVGLKLTTTTKGIPVRSQENTIESTSDD